MSLEAVAVLMGLFALMLITRPFASKHLDLAQAHDEVNKHGLLGVLQQERDSSH